MATPKTTIIVILLAGDLDTTRQIDPLLFELQQGMAALNSTDAAPDVFCFYHRIVDSGAVETWSFRLTAQTLQFLPTQSLLNMAFYPPRGAVQLTDDLNTQLDTFLSSVNDQICSSGPIRFIFGAHGQPGVGLNSTSLFDLLRLFAPGFIEFGEDADLWRERLRDLHQKIIESGSRPGGFAVTSVGRNPDLTLDATAAALTRLPQERFQSTLLHTCELSSIEAIVGLHSIPHHIACESPLSQYMHLSTWFDAWSDPQTSPADLTRSCFAGLSSGISDNALGCFSSNMTERGASVCAKLDELGRLLLSKITQLDTDASASAIQRLRIARLSSQITNSVDICEFCSQLHINGLIPIEIKRGLIEAVTMLQLVPCQMTNDWQGTSSIRRNYKGISVCLPVLSSSTPSVDELPLTFQNAAPDWCAFLNAWSKLI